MEEKSYITPRKQPTAPRLSCRGGINHELKPNQPRVRAATAATNLVLWLLDRHGVMYLHSEWDSGRHREVVSAFHNSRSLNIVFKDNKVEKQNFEIHKYSSL